MYISVSYKDSREGNFLAVVECNTFSSGINYLEKQGFQIIGSNLVTSTMDVKSAMATVSWRLQFSLIEGSSVDTVIIFDDDWKQIQAAIDIKKELGWQIDFMVRQVSSFFSAL
jgi:hypothetical protein